MAGEAGSGALRELLLVVAVALAGLLLAMVAAFAPGRPPRRVTLPPVWWAAQPRRPGGRPRRLSGDRPSGAGEGQAQFGSVRDVVGSAGHRPDHIAFAVHSCSWIPGHHWPRIPRFH
ncbi:hypothetical protein NKG94_42185 [Micromonospora sp. M12]